MSEPAAPEKPDFIEKIADYAGWILAVSVAVIIAAYSFYFFQFRGSLSDDTAIWGQFGDFVGGTLNSVFAFFSFMILLSSLRLQLKELRLTREELEATRKELAASSAAQKMQAEHFERESQKKDCMDAVTYLSDAIVKRRQFVHINSKVGRQYTISADFIKKGDVRIIYDDSYEYTVETCDAIITLNDHCMKLKKIFPDSPILIVSYRKIKDISIKFVEYGWIEKDKIPFFIR